MKAGLVLLAACCWCGPSAAAGWQAAPSPAVNCTDVQVGSAQSYDCINGKLKGLAQGSEAATPPDGTTLQSSSPSNRVGTFNEGATRNRLGPNFGKSAVPFRPPPVNAAPVPR